MVAKFRTQRSAETMNVSHETKMRKEDLGPAVAFNVDIMYSIVGGKEPPTLPLKGEFMTQGVELVLDARGVGEIVVNKEQKRREALLLEKLKRVEVKLENKRSYKRTKKKDEALATVRDLRWKLENSASGITYAMYLDELRRLRSLKKSAKNSSRKSIALEKTIDSKGALDKTIDCKGALEKAIDSTEALEKTIDSVNDSFSCTSNLLTNANICSDTDYIEHQLMAALEVLDDSASFLHFSDGESLDFTNDTHDDSLLSEGTVRTLEITDQSLEISFGDEFRSERENASDSLAGGGIEHTIDEYSKNDFEHSDEATQSSLWSKFGDSSRVSISSHTNYTSTSSTTALINNMTKKGSREYPTPEHPKPEGLDDPDTSIFKSPGSSNVRFKDIKPMTGDTLARARALIENARIIQRNFSADSNSSSIKPSESYDNKKAVWVLDQAYTPDKGRYHLFVSNACPWSHRTLVVRTLKGLEDVISFTTLDCSWEPQPLWNTNAVSNPNEDVSFWSINPTSENKDETYKVFKKMYIDKQKSSTRVPVLWDKISKKVVSNSSSDIMRMLNFDFNKWARRPKLNLFPAAKKTESDEINRWLHRDISVGVYRCGLATSQFKYDEAASILTEALDKANELVSKRGFLIGEKLTESDVRLFVTLVRFDEIYRVLFKTNTRSIASTPGLLEYVRDIYNVKGIKDVCDISAMKAEYFGARAKGDYIIPRGNGFAELLKVEPVSS